MVKVYTLYLSTQTAVGDINAPTDKTNLSRVTWNINWDQLYGSINNNIIDREARLTFQMTTLAQNATYSYAANSGSLAIAGLSNKFSNSANGVVLGAIAPIDNPVNAASSHILLGDTLQTRGVTTYFPIGYAPITVLLLDRTGALQPNVLDYQLILQFEME